MRIDHTHRKWFLGTVIALGVAVAGYVPYSLSAPAGAKGSSPMGLLYGSVGFACMIFAGLLGLRKKFPVWRVGRAQFWMRAHLWLGFLSFPLILLHGGFHFGGPLTRVLMWLFLIVFLSGVLGAILQHYLPRLQTVQLPMETIYEQIARVRGQLLMESVKLVNEACEALGGEVSHASEHQRAASAGAGAMWDVTVASGLQVDERVSADLRRFLNEEIEPYLTKAGSGGRRVSDPAQARALFQQIRVLLPPNLHSTADDLENICDEKRQLDRQATLHKLLHGWLLVHIPLSYAVLLLGAIHAVVAIRF